MNLIASKLGVRISICNYKETSEQLLKLFFVISNGRIEYI